MALLNLSGIEVPTAPVPPTGLGSSGIIINPNQIYSTNSQFATGVGTITGGTYTIDSAPYSSLYTFATNNETLNFTGNVDINGNTGVIASNSGPTTITGASITNDSTMTVKSSGSGLGGFHSNNSTAGYLDFINNNTLDIEYVSGSGATQSLFFYGNINLKNNGTLLLGSNAVISGVAGETYKIPSIVNGGIIYSDGALAADGISLAIKVSPETVVYQSLSSGPQFTANGTSIIADTLTTSKPIVVLPGYADGTNANVYKIENAVVASGGNYEFVNGL